MPFLECDRLQVIKLEVTAKKKKHKKNVQRCSLSLKNKQVNTQKYKVNKQSVCNNRE